jgi:hypothetical protein
MHPHSRAIVDTAMGKRFSDTETMPSVEACFCHTKWARVLGEGFGPEFLQIASITSPLQSFCYKDNPSEGALELIGQILSSPLT